MLIETNEEVIVKFKYKHSPSGMQQLNCNSAEIYPHSKHYNEIYSLYDFWNISVISQQPNRINVFFLCYAIFQSSHYKVWCHSCDSLIKVTCHANASWDMAGGHDTKMPSLLLLCSLMLLHCKPELKLFHGRTKQEVWIHPVFSENNFLSPRGLTW